MARMSFIEIATNIMTSSFFMGTDWDGRGEI